MHISKERASSSFIFKVKTFFCGLIALTATSVANATNITLSWSPSPSAAASGYNLYYGEVSGQYTNKVDAGDETTHTLEELQAGKKYYFAATAYCNCDRFQESNFSAELVVVIPTADNTHTSDVISQNGWSVYVDSEETMGEDGRGVNAIDGNPSTFWHTEWKDSRPTHPHEIQIDLGGIYKIDGFRYLPRQDGSANGRIKGYRFYVSSDGSTWGSPVASGTFPGSAAEQEVMLSAPVTGRFIRLEALSEVNGKPWTSVAELKVMGRPSSDSLLPQGGAFKSAGNLADKNNPDITLPPPMEIGEVLVNHNWTRVTFQQSFADPVVVAPSLGYAGADPGIVRIRNITSDGFDVRMQEWDYLGGPHTKEKIHFIVMERGHYTLPSGARIEAGTIETDSTASFETTHFQQSFNASPIVLTSITSDNDSHAVTVRKKDISTEGFSLLLQEQEANDPIHGLETVDYIAAEPSPGMAGTIPFEVGRTGDVMNHDFQVIPFANSYTNAPIVISDLQTSNGMDTASLRWDDLTLSSIKVKVEEEKSMDDETRHTDETVGYIVFGLNK